MLAAASSGGVKFMPPGQVTRIHTRPDELYRRVRLEGDANPANEGPIDG